MYSKCITCILRWLYWLYIVNYNPITIKHLQEFALKDLIPMGEINCKLYFVKTIHKLHNNENILIIHHFLIVYQISYLSHN